MTVTGTTFDLVVAANRLPVERVADGEGVSPWRPSPGGLVAALEPVMRDRDAAWVGWPGEPGDPARPAGSFRQDRLYVRPVGLSSHEIQQYYEGFSNGLLWPLYHDVIVPDFHRSWWNAYRAVNDRFARAVAEVAAPGATVWVHDYHLQLVPAMVRELRPDLRIGWFDHIPFPPVELFAQLPWRGELLEGLLGADFLGFQRAADAENFLRSCRRLLAMPTDGDTATVTRPGGRSPRTVRVGALPISVDFKALDTLARTPQVVARAAEIRAGLGNPEILMLGADRLDYTKGFPARLKACQELLRDRAIAPPEVTLMLVALPSREHIDAYRRLRAGVEATIARINDDYSVSGSAAVHYQCQFVPRPEMAATFLAADVMLVTPLRDGMNLVAKEYVSCRPDLGGALVLSEFAGAWHELHEAFSCNPHDIEGLKRTIMAAITAPADERRRRMTALRRRVCDNDVQRWASRYLQALACAPSRPHAPGGTFVA